MKLTKLILRSLLGMAVGALPAVLSAQNLPDWPVPAYLDDAMTYVPIFVDPEATVNGSGTSWDDPLQLAQLGGALPLPAYQTAQTPDGVIIVIKEWRTTVSVANDTHEPITSAVFLGVYNNALLTTFGGLPTEGVRWGFTYTNTGRSNSRMAHDANSDLGEVAPLPVVASSLDMTGSYQTVLPNGGLGSTLVASGIPVVSNRRVLDGVNIQAGRQVGDSFPLDRGAGLRIDDTNNVIFITDSQFTDNFASALGGAIYSPVGSEVVLANVHFWENQAERVGGGAIYNESDDFAIYQSTFDTNRTAQGQGGAYYGFPGSDVDFVSNVFSNNNADQQGGAVYLSNNSVSSYVNNHFVGNTSELNGGALFFAETAEIDGSNVFQGLGTSDNLAIAGDDYDFYNNVFIFNEGAGSSTLSGQIRITVGNPIALLSNGDFDDQKNVSYAFGDVVPVRDASADPRGSDDLLGTDDDNVIPTSEGVLVNAGINAAVPIIGYFQGAKNLDAGYLDFFPLGWTDPQEDHLDVKNDPRIFQGTVEIGAYEIQGEIPDVPPPPKIIYVDDNAPGDENGVHDGNTWESAYLFVQDALKRAELDPSVTEIWIAEAENMEKSHILTRESLPARSEFVDAPVLWWNNGPDAVSVGNPTDGTPLGVLRNTAGDIYEDDGDVALDREDEVASWKVPANYCILSGEELDEQVRRTAYNPGRRTGLYVTVGDVRWDDIDFVPHFDAIVEHAGFGIWNPILGDGSLNIQVPTSIDARPVRGDSLGTVDSPKTFNAEPYPIPSYFSKDRYEEQSRLAYRGFNQFAQADIYEVQGVPITYLRSVDGQNVRTIIYSPQDVPVYMSNGSEIPYFSVTPVLGILLEQYIGQFANGNEIMSASGNGFYRSPNYRRDVEYDPTLILDQIGGYTPFAHLFNYSFSNEIEQGIGSGYAFNIRRDLDDRRVTIYGGFDGWRVFDSDFVDLGGIEVPNVYDYNAGDWDYQYQVMFNFSFGDADDSWEVSPYDRERFLAQRSDSNETILSGDLDVSKYTFTRWSNPDENVSNSWVDNRHSVRVMHVHSDKEMLSNVDRGELMLQSHLQVEWISGADDISTVDDIGPGSAAPDPDWSYDADETFVYTFDDDQDTEIRFMMRDKHNYIIEELSVVDGYADGTFSVVNGAGVFLEDTFAYLADVSFSGNRSSGSGAALVSFSGRSDSGAMIIDSCFSHNSALTGTSNLDLKIRSSSSIYSGMDDMAMDGVVSLGGFGDVTIINSNFLHNRAMRGGAIGVTGNTNATIHNSVFVGNTAASAGGAIFLDQSVNVGVYSSLFSGNNATSGGAIASFGAIYDVMNSVFSENTAAVASAVAINESAPYFLNTIFYRNMRQSSALDDPFGEPIGEGGYFEYNGLGGSPIIHDSVVTGQINFTVPNGANIITDDPMFDSVDVFKGASGLYFYPAVPVAADECSIAVYRKFDDLTCSEINALKGDDGLFGTSDDSLGFMLTEGSPALGTGFDGQDIGIYKDQGDAVAREPSIVENVFPAAVYLGGDWVRVPELGNDHMWVGWEPYVYSITHGWIYPIAGAEGIYLWIYNGTWNLFMIDLDNFEYPLADDLLDDSDDLVPLPFTGM